MSKIVRLSEWPFEQNEKAKLIWIGEPFKQNRRWMVKAYFRSSTGQETKTIIVDWPTIHFLSMGKIYSNGIMNKVEVEEGTCIMDINLDSIQPYYNEREWHIHGTSENGISRTYSFKKGSKLYVVPSIEIIRGILGIDSFTLRLILSMDNLFEYLIYEVEEDVLSIYFSNEYNKKLLTNDKVYHLAWILTNSGVLSMFNHISNSYNIDGNERLNFKFEMERFNIRARVKIKGNRIFVQEILELKNKKINANQIYVEHPNIEKPQITINPKKREYITYTDATNKQVNMGEEVDGANKDLEMIKCNDTIHNYSAIPEIIKGKMEKRQRRSSVDENTKRYYYNDKGKRTLREEGGKNTVKGLEFCKAENIRIEGELKKFVQIVKILETKPEICSIDMLIDKLPIGNGGKFAWLEDGVTPRKFVFCKIIMKNGRERALFEIERENKSLSILVMKSNRKEDWKTVCFKVLYGLVKNNGSWRKEDITEVSNLGIKVMRKRHINSVKNNVVEQIYETIE